jgi:hypothetical protein
LGQIRCGPPAHAERASTNGDDYQVRRLLHEFKEEIRDFSKRRISEVASQILKKDARSLLGQFSRGENKDDEHNHD